MTVIRRCLHPILGKRLQVTPRVDVHLEMGLVPRGLCWPSSFSQRSSSPPVPCNAIPCSLEVHRFSLNLRAGGQGRLRHTQGPDEFLQSTGLAVDDNLQ